MTWDELNAQYGGSTNSSGGSTPGNFSSWDEINSFYTDQAAAQQFNQQPQQPTAIGNFFNNGISSLINRVSSFKPTISPDFLQKANNFVQTSNERDRQQQSMDVARQKFINENKSPYYLGDNTRIREGTAEDKVRSYLPISGQAAVDKSGWVGKFYTKGASTAYSSFANANDALGKFFEVTDVVNNIESPEDLKNFKPATFAEKAAATINLGVNTVGLIPQWLAFTSGLEAAKEIPGIGVGAKVFSKGFEKLGEGGARVAGKALDYTPISNQSKDVLRQPIESLGSLAAQIGVGAGAAKGGSKVVKTAKEYQQGKVALGEQVALQKQLETYNKELKKTVDEYQKKGVEITPQIAEVINNNTLKQVPVDTAPGTMKIPSSNGNIGLYTEQPVLLQNMIRGREAINYKVVDSLQDKSGKPVQAKFEWDYKNQEATIYTTKRAIAHDIAYDLGHYLDHKVVSTVSQKFKDLMPGYIRKADQNNGALAAYAVDSLGGNANVKQINTKIKRLADNFDTELSKLSTSSTFQAKFADAVNAVINDTTAAKKQAPNLTDFIHYGLSEKGAVANAVQANAVRGGVSTITLNYGRKKFSEERMIADYNAQPKQLTAPTENLQLTGTVGGLEKIKGVVKELQPLAQEAIRHGSIDDFVRVLESKSPSPKLQEAIDTLPRGEKQARAVLEKVYNATQKQIKELENQPKTTFSVDKQGNTVEKTADGNVVKITDKKGEVLYEVEQPAKTTQKTSKKASTEKATESYQTEKTNESTTSESKTSGAKAEGVKNPISKETKDLNSKVYNRLKEENPEALTGELTYEVIKLQEDAAKAVDLISKDKEQAYRIAMGLDESKSVTSTAVNIAMAEKALVDGNTNLYAQLTKNRSLAQTRRGQEISAERGSITDNSTSRYVKELISTRLELLDKKYLSGIQNKIRSKTNKAKATEIIDREVVKVQKKLKNKELDLSMAQKFIDSLACK